MSKKIIKISKNQEEIKKDKALYVIVSFFMILVVIFWSINLKKDFSNKALAKDKDDNLIKELVDIGKKFENNVSETKKEYQKAKENIQIPENITSEILNK